MNQADTKSQNFQIIKFYYFIKIILNTRKFQAEMKISKLTSNAKINLDLKIKYYDKIIKKHKISSKVVLLKLNDLITISNSTKLQITYYDQNKKINSIF